MTSSNQTSWLYRAGAARAQGTFATFLGDSLGSGILIILVYAASALIGTLPIQAALEAIVWLKDGEFMNYSWVDYLDSEQIGKLTSTDLIGVNRITNWMLNIWISATLAITGFVGLLLAAFFQK